VHSVDEARRTYSIRLLDGTVEHNVHFTSVVFPSSDPIIPFQSYAALPRYFDNDFGGEWGVKNKSNGHGAYKVGSMLTQSKEAVMHTTTAHLLRMLRFAQSWDDACGESADRQVSLISSHPDVDMLCGQMVWIGVTCIAMHSSTGVDIQAIEDQLLDIQDIIKRDPPRGDGLHWINSDTWESIREWVDVMTSRILSPYRDHGEWSYEVPDAETSFNMATASSRPKGGRWGTEPHDPICHYHYV
jgi:hypothetical protein